MVTCEMPSELRTEVEGEVIRLLSDLIRINTTNPPGNEIEAAKYLADALSGEGFSLKRTLTVSICYGFHPRLPEAMYGKTITRERGIDERISIKDLIFGTSVLYDTIRRFLS